MKIGEPRREIYVEPIELPEPLRKIAEPSPDKSVGNPEEEPVTHGDE